MAIKKQGFHKLTKKKEEQRREHIAALSFQKDRGRVKKKRTKNITYEDMVGLNNLPLPVVRDKEKWVCKTYNEYKRKVDFIKWCHCKYYVPTFLFSLYIGVDGYTLNYFKIFEKWFMAIANGLSFYKETKEFFTKKEAHIFLHCPNENSIIKNFWLCKCLAIDLDKSLTSMILNRSETISIHNKSWTECIHFVKVIEKDINKNEFLNVLDFLVTTCTTKSNFSFKGRTWSSIVKLSNEWHLEQQRRLKGNTYIHLTWPGYNIADWVYVDKNKTKWTCTQLKTAKDLQKEGNAMRHCVGGYAKLCHDGQSAVFSLKKVDIVNQEERVATIEINKNKQIVQARGKLNRRLKTEEEMTLKKWASKNGLTFNTYF